MTLNKLEYDQACFHMKETLFLRSAVYVIGSIADSSFCLYISSWLWPRVGFNWRFHNLPWGSAFDCSVSEKWREGVHWSNQKWNRKEWMRPWRYVKSVTVWIIQLLFSFKKLLFKATLSFTRFRGGSTLRFHSSFRPWAGTVCYLDDSPMK